MFKNLNLNNRELSLTQELCMDESMPAYKLRTTKLGGMPNVSYVARKPKPQGTETKSACDVATFVMRYLKIHECKGAMRVAEGAMELGVTAAVSKRITVGDTLPGATAMGDSWSTEVMTTLKLDVILLAGKTHNQTRETRPPVAACSRVGRPREQTPDILRDNRPCPFLPLL